MFKSPADHHRPISFGASNRVELDYARTTHLLTRSSPCEDYRHGGQTKVMTLDAGEFIHRFLLHVLPEGFHRIRYYGNRRNGPPKCRRKI